MKIVETHYAAFVSIRAPRERGDELACPSCS